MRIHKRRVRTRETATAKKDGSGMSILSETSDLSVWLGFLGVWGPFAWKEVNYLAGTQWPSPALGSYLPSRCFRQKKSKENHVSWGEENSQLLQRMTFTLPGCVLKLVAILYWKCILLFIQLWYNHRQTSRGVKFHGFPKGTRFSSLFHYVLLCLDFYHLCFSSQHFRTVIYIQMVSDSCPITCRPYLLREGEIFWYVLSKPFIEWSLVNDFDGMKEEKIFERK